MDRCNFLANRHGDSCSAFDARFKENIDPSNPAIRLAYGVVNGGILEERLIGTMSHLLMMNCVLNVILAEDYSTDDDVCN